MEKHTDIPSLFKGDRIWSFRSHLPTDLTNTLTSNLRCYFNYSRKGRKEGPVGQVTRRRGTVEQVGGTPLSAVFCPKGLHTSNSPINQVTNKIISQSNYCKSSLWIQKTTEYGKSSQFLEAKVRLTINNSPWGHMGIQGNKFPYYQEWDHQFPLQRKKSLLPCFLPKISMTPAHTYPCIFRFPLEI